jgi:uncharacterized damage-inducible protein DinB
MNLRRHCELMTRYQRWATEKLYAHVEQLDDAAYRRNVGLFFESVHRTLNHLLLVDHLWLGRMTGEPFAFDTLGDEVEPDRERLKERLLARPADWLDWMARLTDVELTAMASSRKIDGTPGELPRASVVLHVANHGTHHRGQISAALTQAGVAAPEIDLPYFLYTLPKHDLL